MQNQDVSINKKRLNIENDEIGPYRRISFTDMANQTQCGGLFLTLLQTRLVETWKISVTMV